MSSKSPFMVPANVLVRLIAPPQCVFCSVFLSIAEENHCQPCGSAIQAEWTGGTLSVVRYEGVVRDSIRRAKFRGEVWRLTGQGRLLGEAVTAAGWCVDHVVAVPSVRARRICRGYNPAAVAARACAKHLGLRCAYVLEREGTGPAQHTLNRNERSAILGSYHCTRAISGRVLLVDDVVTTGNTLRAASLALLQGGAIRVLTAAIAATPRNRPNDRGSVSLSSEDDTEHNRNRR